MPAFASWRPGFKGKRSAKLSITHKSRAQEKAEMEVGQTCEVSPDDHVARWRVVCAGQSGALSPSHHQLGESSATAGTVQMSPRMML